MDHSEIIGVATVTYWHPPTENGCHHADGEVIKRVILVQDGQTGSQIAFEQHCGKPIRTSRYTKRCHERLEAIDYDFIRKKINLL